MTYLVWVVSFFLIVIAGGNSSMGFWQWAAWMFPLCMLASMAAVVWENSERRIEREWQRLNQERERQRHDEEWFRMVHEMRMKLRTFGIEIEQTYDDGSN